MCVRACVCVCVRARVRVERVRACGSTLVMALAKICTAAHARRAAELWVRGRCSARRQRVTRGVRAGRRRCARVPADIVKGPVQMDLPERRLGNRRDPGRGRAARDSRGCPVLPPPRVLGVRRQQCPAPRRANPLRRLGGREGIRVWRRARARARAVTASLSLCARAGCRIAKARHAIFVACQVLQVVETRSTCIIYLAESNVTWAATGCGTRTRVEPPVTSACDHACQEAGVVVELGRQIGAPPVP